MTRGTMAGARWAGGAALTALAALGALAAAAGAQEPGRPAAGPPGAPEEPARPTWQARASYGQESIASDAPQWSPWIAYGASAARRFARGSVALELSRARRFSVWDEAAAVDAYRTLWRGAYGNVRAQLTPSARVLPRHDVSAELFQGLGGGWEPSLAVRRMAFSERTVDFVAASLARFVGPWYARARATWVPNGSRADAGSVAALARRYLRGSGDAWVEASAGAGGEAVTLGAADDGGPVVDVRRTTFVTLGGQWLLGRHLGASASASYNTFAGVPDRRGATLGAVVRW